ncbi:hypothetical protein CN300_04400 [Bacillus thuringiensis]|uniref:ABC-three component system middle component 2 n=1 Tax=Bacillus thuringiensis TaxID=1428 RepID=UPI000BF63434|nr:ABC-three component system middle component 2 [Bacillus thuringiensis]PFC48142.1 hypothetical protein CN300_04400 [Bacillus thuringiensis]
MKNKFISKRNVDVFNTPIEVGLRALIILNQLSARSMDLNELVIYDYMITHSNDVDDSTESLHPSTPYRSGEIIIKRKVMQEGINLMYSRELLDIEYTKNGVYYKSNELTLYFIKHLVSNYAQDVIQNANRISKQFENYSEIELNEYINRNISKWGSEFTKESLVRGGFNE